MNTKNSSTPHWATVAGLVTGAAGIAILWASGVPFPFVIPPGLVILLAGAFLVGLAPWPWVSAVGAFLGLFVTVGFLISPSGVPNLLGQNGTSVLIGTCIQMLGVLTALIAGVISIRLNYRDRASVRA